jgi:hypothetical protein
MHRTIHMFVDESGDLGLSLSSSKHLVVAALATAEPRLLARIARRSRRRYGLEGVGELKFNKDGDRLRRAVLESIGDTDSFIAWGAVIKANAPRDLKGDPNGLYQYLVRRTVSDLSMTIHAKRVRVLIDRRSTEPTVRRALEGRIASDVAMNHAGYLPPAVVVGHMDSVNSEGLQIADYVAGAVFQRLEREDGSYLRPIVDRVVRGRTYW